MLEIVKAAKSAGGAAVVGSGVDQFYERLRGCGGGGDGLYRRVVKQQGGTQIRGYNVALLSLKYID